MKEGDLTTAQQCQMIAEASGWQARALKAEAALVEGREVEVRHFEEWHEDIGTVLWHLDPIQEAPYCGTPLDLGATWSMEIFDGIGQTVGERESHRFQVGAWPFSEEQEPRLWWTRLPDLNAVQTAIRKLSPGEGA